MSYVFFNFFLLTVTSTKNEKEMEAVCCSYDVNLLNDMNAAPYFPELILLHMFFIATMLHPTVETSIF
jgi:hypothetical protein